MHSRSNANTYTHTRHDDDMWYVIKYYTCCYGYSGAHFWSESM